MERGPRIVATAGGLSVSSGSLWLYSRYAPRAAAERAAAELPLKPDTLYLAPSPCLGYGFETLLARLPASSAVLAVEAEPELAALSRPYVEALKPHPRFAFIATDSAPAAAAAARRLGRHRRVEELRLSQGYRLREDFYALLVRSLAEDLSIHWRNRVSMARMGRLWTKNCIANLGAMDWSRVEARPSNGRGPGGPGGSKLRDEAPVVVCGAGPSLDVALPFLRGLGEGVRILACDTAAGALSRAGVRVDAVVCLEAQVYNVGDFLPMPAAARGPTAYLDLSAHPSSYRALSGSLRLLSSRWTDCGFLDRLAAAGLPIEPLPPLGSVGVLALRLAVGRYRGPVFVAGLDFAYPAGRSHCSGSPVDLAERRQETRLYKYNSRWKISFGPGVERLRAADRGAIHAGRVAEAEPRLLTDPALKLYAGLAARELNERGLSPGCSAYDLRDGRGARLPARPVDFNEAALAMAVASDSRDAPGGGPEDSSGASARDWAERARAFLSEELRLSRILRAALRGDEPERSATEARIPTGDGTSAGDGTPAGDGTSACAGTPAGDGSPESRLRELIIACDYMYAHFPDPERVEALELDALKRLAAEGAYWEARLASALAMAEGR